MNSIKRNLAVEIEYLELMRHIVATKSVTEIVNSGHEYSSTKENWFATKTALG